MSVVLGLNVELVKGPTGLLPEALRPFKTDSGSAFREKVCEVDVGS